MKKLTVLAAALLAGVAIPAGADPIAYTFSGTFSGTINGGDFTADAVFTGLGDTSTLSQSGLTRYVNLTSLAAVSGGTTFNILSTTQFYLNGGNYAGLFFGSGGNGGGGFSATAPGLAGYDAVSSLPTTALTAYFTGPVSFNTDAGPVTLSSFSNGTFGAVLSAAGVPEPSTWALMIVGFGAIGGAMRRRASVRTTVAFA